MMSSSGLALDFSKREGTRHHTDVEHGVVSERAKSPSSTNDMSPVEDTGERDRRHGRIDERDFTDHRRAVYVGLHMSQTSLEDLSSNGGGRHHHHHHHHHHHRRHHHGRHHRHSSSSNGGSSHHHHHHHHKHKHRSDSDSMAPLTTSGHMDTQPLHPMQGPSERVRTLLNHSMDEDCPETHDLFTELEELQLCDGGMEWKERARWVKYEEDVEWGGEKWSKPHVAALSLHSLFELRSCIVQGTVLLNMNASDLTTIADLVLDDLIATRQLEEMNRELVRSALLCRHTHQNQKTSHNRPSFRRRNTNDESTKQPPGLTPLDSVAHLAPPDHSSLRQTSLPDSSPATARRQVADSHFMKKLPPNAEASNVLVGQVEFLHRPLIAFVRLAESVILGDLTEVPLPTRFLFILLGPKGEEERYHEIGRSISTLMADPVFHNVAYVATSRSDLLAGVDEFLDQVVVLPPGEWDPTIRLAPPASPRKASERLAKNASAPMPSREKPLKGHGSGGGENGDGTEEDPGKDLHHAGLKRTKRCFGGLVDDVKRRWPFYFWSDFKDAFHPQILPAILFIYFAAIAPTITFGGLLEDTTDGYMGTMEMIVASCFCGMVYALTAGQPLTILGATGPFLVFEGIVYTFAKENELPFLQFRFWIGMWTMLFLIVVVATDASFLIGFFTRFTEETFSTLISFIFIYEALIRLHELEVDHPPLGAFRVNSTLDFNCSCFADNTSLGQMPSSLTLSACSAINGTAVGDGCPPAGADGDIFFLSAIELFGTFTIAFLLKKFRNTPYFPTKVREIISDFAVVIAIAAMLVVDLVYSVDTPKLNVPTTFRTTRENRGWIVQPVNEGMPWWLPLAAIIPAILSVILVFMDQQITALLVNRREHKLKKGPGYHLDLLVVSILIGFCSLFGLPWLVAATVRSLTHVNALSVMDSNTAPGEKPKFLGVREQRITNFAVFFLHGVSIFAAPALKHLPLPILYGLFLFMGVSSLRGVQFVERLELLVMPEKFQYDVYYVRHVPMLRMHLFTAIQLVSLVVLCVFKLTKASLVFPIAVVLLVPVRHCLKFFFTGQELEILDDKMPELLKRKKQDAKKKRERAAAVEVTSLDGSDEREQRIPRSTSVASRGEGDGLRQRYVNGVIERGTKEKFNMTDEVDRCDLWQHTHSRVLQQQTNTPAYQLLQHQQSSTSIDFSPLPMNGTLPEPAIRESAL